jgi:hypothetical protein
MGERFTQFKREMMQMAQSEFFKGNCGTRLVLLDKKRLPRKKKKALTVSFGRNAYKLWKRSPFIRNERLKIHF